MTQDDVRSFNDYLQLEQRLFRQLDVKVYAKTGTGPDQALNRYSPGSFADPRKRQPDWNRSFEWDGAGAGGVLLLHGMSDSPYSLRVSWRVPEPPWLSRHRFAPSGPRHGAIRSQVHILAGYGGRGKPGNETTE